MTQLGRDYDRERGLREELVDALSRRLFLLPSRTDCNNITGDILVVRYKGEIKAGSEWLVNFMLVRFEDITLAIPIP